MDRSPANRWTTGRGFLEALREESNEITEMLTLAVAVSDQYSQFDIEYGCTVVVLGSGEWIDTAQPSPEVIAMDEGARRRFGNQLARAIRYLDLRGQLLRNPGFPHLVRFATEETLN